MNKTENRSVVLNVMYNGRYLNDNMGHEIINLFKADAAIDIKEKKYQHFLYLNPYGNYGNGKVVTDMLLVISVPGKEMFEVVGVAKGLTPIFKFEKNFSPSEKEPSDTQKLAATTVHEDQLEKIKEITYGGAKLENLFKNDKQQSVYVTYAAENVFRPKTGVRIYIEFIKGPVSDRWDSKANLLKICSQAKAKQSQKQYFINNDDDENNNDLEALLTNIIDNDALWSGDCVESLPKENKQSETLPEEKDENSAHCQKSV